MGEKSFIRETKSDRHFLGGLHRGWVALRRTGGLELKSNMYHYRTGVGSLLTILAQARMAGSININLVVRTGLECRHSRNFPRGTAFAAAVIL